MRNVDEATVRGFGDEWTRLDQSGLPADERQRIFDDYFAVFPWDRVGPGSVGADIGCGSGRWAMLAAPRIGTLHCVDPSDAIEVARRNCARLTNVQFHHAEIGALPFADGSLDLAYSLGVLHHVPDTAGALRDIARKLKPGAPFLVYLYYAFDNRPAWFRLVWRISDLCRQVIARLPHALRYWVSQVIAALVYWPLARTARLLERMGRLPESFPLAFYRDASFYTMRTDALDRFGTRLEKRFARGAIASMLQAAGFKDVVFSEHTPYWCAVGIKA